MILRGALIRSGISTELVALAETARKEFPDHRIDVPRVEFEQSIDDFLTSWLSFVDGDPYAHHKGGVLFVRLRNGERVRITINRTEPKP